MTKLSQEHKSLVAAGLIAKFSRDYQNRFMDQGDKTSIDDVVKAAKQCGISHRELAGAYFVEQGSEDSSALKDLYDRAIQKYFGDEYAMGFLESLANFEQELTRGANMRA